MRRLTLALGIAALVVALSAPAAYAQQSVNFFIGGFSPQSLRSRQATDVFVQDGLFLATFDRNVGIDMGRFNQVTVGGEWLFGLGDHFDGGLGISFYQKTVPTYDINYFNNQTGGDIVAGLKMRIVPFSATVRFLPLGHHDAFEPYIGGGVNAYYWRYSESGQFVDYSSCDNTGCNLFQGNFVGSGGAVGPVILGGIRVPVGPVSLGGEVRWQDGSGNLPGNQGFAGTKIDLGGVNYLFTFGVRF